MQTGSHVCGSIFQLLPEVVVNFFPLKNLDNSLVLLLCFPNSKPSVSFLWLEERSASFNNDIPTILRVHKTQTLSNLITPKHTRMTQFYSTGASPGPGFGVCVYFWLSGVKHTFTLT